MRFLAIVIVIVFALFDLTKANYYGGDFMSSYTGQEPNYGQLPIGLGFPVNGYSQVGPYLPPASPAPSPQAPPPAPAPAPKSYASYPPVFGPILTPFGSILPTPYHSQPPVFIPTHIDTNGRRHIRLGDHSFVQEEETDNTVPGNGGMGTGAGAGTGTGSGSGYGYYSYYTYPSAKPPPTTSPATTTLATTTAVITTTLSANPTTTPTSVTTTQSTVPGSTTGSAKGGVQNLSFYRYGNGYGQYSGYEKNYGNYGLYGPDGKLNIDVNANNELIFNDGTQPLPQTTTTLPTVTSTSTTTGKGSTKYLNRKKTSKFHFKITPDNLLNVITL